MRERGQTRRIQLTGAPAKQTSKNRRTRARGASAGTTLIELIIACAILIVLASAAVPLMRVTVKGAKERQLRASLREMRDAIDRYKDYADKGKFQVQAGTEGYPPDLEILVKGVQVTSGGLGGGLAGVPAANLSAGGFQTGSQQQQMRVRFLRAIPMDPMTKSREWGLRSVQDDPDSTSWGGHDVFDVYSRSTGTALDGTKYSDW
ncbi:MAG TPA: type II secretion system protein [Candidatus Sulfotelmatobacter sp.]|nr:type II secretion system protein [Candidatus Sulfotelmatobacter sp.]